MIIGTVSENKEQEKRISITPEIAKKYISNGFEVMIEKDLATHLGILDKEFLEEGCKIDSRENVLNKSNIILQLNLPDEKSTNLLNENKILIGNFNSSLNKEVIAKISNKKIYSILEVAKFFKAKVKFLPKRDGERYASALTNLSYNNKVHKRYGKIQLKDYINSFIKRYKK